MSGFQMAQAISKTGHKRHSKTFQTRTISCLIYFRPFENWTRPALDPHCILCLY